MTEKKHPSVSGKGRAGRSLLVTGLVRNTEASLAADVARLGSALAGAGEIHWFLVESDSTDGTVAALQAQTRETANFRFVSLGFLEPDLPGRSERIAHCRNACLAEIRANPAYQDLDYVAVADFDGVNDLISAEAIASCWTRDDWDMCAANRLGPYYDVWALRHPIWSPGDCWDQARFLQAHGADSARAITAAVYAKMITLSPQAEWIEVDSAFGGLAIYRRAALDDGAYDGLTETGAIACEHVAFHADLRRAGRRLFINPALIGGGVNEHSRPALEQPGLESINLSPEQAMSVTAALLEGVPQCAGQVEELVAQARIRLQTDSPIVNSERALFGGLSTQQVFTKIYEEGHWGRSQAPGQAFYSGTGSHNTAVVGAYVQQLNSVFSQFARKPDVVDLGCGDFAVGSQLRGACRRYTACDIVEPLIAFNRRRYAALAVDFRVLDLTRDSLPPGDVCLVRQVLQHLSNAEIAAALPRLASTYRFLVISEHLPAQAQFIPNLDKPTGRDSRLPMNSGVVLTSPPFDLKPRSAHVLCEVVEGSGVIRTILYDMG